MIEVARLLLAAVFAVAGLAKLADLGGAARAARDFGAPNRLGLPVAVLVSGVEIAIAIGLLITGSARTAAGAGAAVLIAFAAAVAIARLRGRTPDCHCFGRLHSAPAGWGVVARNLCLAALAAVVASQQVSPIGITELAAFGIATVLAGQALLSYTLLRRYGRALRRLDELETRGVHERVPRIEVGGEAPAFSLPTLDGTMVSLRDLLGRGRNLLLVFVDPECGPCHALGPELGELARRQSTTSVVLASRGPIDENIILAESFEASAVLLQMDRELSDLYDIDATPSAVLVGGDGLVVSRAIGGAAIVELLRGGETARRPSLPRRGEGHVPRVAMAASLAGGAAALAASAGAAPGEAERATQNPPDPDLQAIHAALRSAGPRLVAAARRSSKAVVAQATLRTGPNLRKKQAAAVRALELERKEVLRLRSTLDALSLTSRTAFNARASALIGLSVLALSLQKRKRAITATPNAANRLLADSERLFASALDSIASSAQQLGRG